MATSSTNGSDFYLVVKPDVTVSTSEFMKGMNEIIQKLDAQNYKVKIGIDDGGQLKNLKTQLDEVANAQKKTGMTSLATSMDKLADSVAKADTGLDTLVKSVTEITQSIKTLVSAIPESGSALSNMAKEGSAGIAELQTQLQGLLELMTQLNAKDFNISNTFSYSKGGVVATDITELNMYKTQATELISVIEQLLTIFSSLNKYKDVNPLNGLKEGIYTLSLQETGYTNQLSNAYMQLATLPSQIDAAKTLQPIKLITNELQQMYSMMQAVANQLMNAHDVEDIWAHVNTSGLTTATESLKNYQAQSTAAEQSFLNAAQSVSQFGIAAQETALKATTANDSTQTEKIKSMCTEASTLLDELRAKIEQTFDLSTVNLNQQSILNVIDQLKSQFSNLEIKVSTASIQNVVASSAPTSTTSNTVTQIRDISEAASQATTQINGMSAALSKANAQTINDALNGINGISSMDASKLASTLQQCDVEIKNISAAWTQAESGAQSVLNLAVQGTNQYGATLKYLISYDQETGEIADVTTRLNQQVGQTAEQTRALKDGFNQMLSAAKQMDSMQVKLFNLQLSGNNDNQIATLDAQLGAIKSNYQQLVDVFGEQLSTDQWAKLNSVFNETSNKISLMASAAADADKKVVLFSEDADALRSATEQVSSAMSKVSTMKGWTMAESGTTSGVYAQLNGFADSLNNLMERLKSGDIKTLEEFNQEFVSLKTSISQASEAMTFAEENHKKSTEAVVSEETATRKYNSAIATSEGYLRNYTAAKNSHNTSSRLAYENIQKEVTAMKQAHQQYKDNQISAAQLVEVISTSTTNIKGYTNTIKENNDATKSLTDRMGGLADKFTSWLTVSQVIMTAIRAMKKMVTQSIELEDSMTQLKIVTNETEEAYAEFGDTIADTAQKIGASITDLVDSTTTYARLGYDLEESSTLAELTAMLQNVGDIDVEDAQSALTSMIKAFDVDVSDMESVMDKLVAVGNNYPISVEEISTGMTNASSALSAAGNSIEQSIALLTAANTTINLCRVA